MSLGTFNYNDLVLHFCAALPQCEMPFPLFSACCFKGQFKGFYTAGFNHLWLPLQPPPPNLALLLSASPAFPTIWTRQLGVGKYIPFFSGFHQVFLTAMGRSGAGRRAGRWEGGIDIRGLEGGIERISSNTVKAAPHSPRVVGSVWEFGAGSP